MCIHTGTHRILPIDTQAHVVTHGHTDTYTDTHRNTQRHTQTHSQTLRHKNRCTHIDTQAC